MTKFEIKLYENIKKTSAKLEFYKPSPISLYARITTQRPCKVAQFTPIPGFHHICIGWKEPNANGGKST